MKNGNRSTINADVFMATTKLPTIPKYFCKKCGRKATPHIYSLYYPAIGGKFDERTGIERIRIRVNYYCFDCRKKLETIIWTKGDYFNDYWQLEDGIVGGNRSINFYGEE